MCVCSKNQVFKSCYRIGNFLHERGKQMKKIILLLLGFVTIIFLVKAIMGIKEINQVEDTVIGNYIEDIKAGNLDTVYGFTEKNWMNRNDEVVSMFVSFGNRINNEKLNEFLNDPEYPYSYYEVEKGPGIIKKIKEYNDKSLTRSVVFYLPSEGDYRRNKAYIPLYLVKINDEWIVLGSHWRDIEIEKNGKPSSIEIAEPWYE